MAFSRELIISIINLTITIIGVVSQFFGNFLADKLQKTIDEGPRSLKDCVTLLKELNKRLDRPIFTGTSSQSSSSRFMYEWPADVSRDHPSSDQYPSFYNPSAAFQV